MTSWDVIIIWFELHQINKIDKCCDLF